MEDYILHNPDLFYTHTDENMREERKCYIGGSDSPAFGAKIMGFPYMWVTEFMVWCKKKNIKKEDDNPFMAYGRATEAGLRIGTPTYLSNTFPDEQPFNVYVSPATYRMKKYNFIGANIDGVIREGNGDLAGLEIKTTRWRSGWENTKFKVPDNYVCQAQHYMLCTGLKRYYFVCEIQESGGVDIIVRRLEADPDFHEKLVQEYVYFWENNILKDVPPQRGGIPKESAYINALPNKYLEKDDPVFEKIKEYEQKKEDVKRLNAELKVIARERGYRFTIQGYDVHLKKSSGIRFSSPAFKEAHPDLYEQYRLPSEITESLYINDLTKESKSNGFYRGVYKKRKAVMDNG